MDRILIDESIIDFYFTFSPQSLLNGMNNFLESLEITFRRDPNNFRPRINKNNSVKVLESFFLLNIDVKAEYFNMDLYKTFGKQSFKK